MDVRRILVSYKHTTFERFSAAGDSTLQALIDGGEISVDALKRSHDAHHRSLDRVVAHLQTLGIPVDAVFRGDVDEIGEHDLVVCVGGDGTVLDLSHKVEQQPLLAINSDPEMSYGYFCAGTADDIEDLISRVLAGDWPPVELFRFGVAIDGEPVGSAILNDILVAHQNPAAVTSYVLRVGESDDEAQKSSGIWISTAAGSTAAIRSAGGYVLPLDSKRIQYLVREPCPPTVGLYRHVKGIREPTDRFEVVSKMPDGRVYLDGPHLGVEFSVGKVLTIRPDVAALKIFGIADKIRD